MFHKKNGLVTCVAWRLQEIVYYISWVSLTVDGRGFKGSSYCYVMRTSEPGATVVNAV